MRGSADVSRDLACTEEETMFIKESMLVINYIRNWIKNESLLKWMECMLR